MNEKGFIQYFVIIGVILAVAFFSQPAHLKGNQKTFISDASDQAKAYLSQGADWTKANLYPKISGEVQKRGDMVKEGVEKEKEKVSETISEKISNYFSGVAESIIHPGTPQNCPAPNVQ
ncbi:MAG: hypothetical protein Q8Q48_00110 [Candidatus Staskawiczbacteria bacterium]|nr:hypothetical protein [Candidatus Staskawiczbacteria bacterium]